MSITSADRTESIYSEIHQRVEDMVIHVWGGGRNVKGLGFVSSGASITSEKAHSQLPIALVYFEINFTRKRKLNTSDHR
jgi:hypothetical protein